MSTRSRRKLWAYPLAILAAVLIAVWLWYSAALGATKGEDKTVNVPPGATSQTIATLLHQAGLIKSERAFLWHAKLNRLGGKWQQGRFALHGKDSAPEIATRLTHKPDISRVTITEGLTQGEIADRLAKAADISADEFRSLKAADFDFDFLKDLPDGASLEGFLFPDTYDIPSERPTAHGFAETMLRTFDDKVDGGLRREIAAHGHSLYDTLIIASIVEREVQTDEDRRMVAGIFWKRLEQGIPLGADTTLLYGLDKGGNYELTVSDLASDNPYNTRKLKGLPPGPIGNPGVAGIKAAADPQDSDYLYYLTDPKTKKTIYAKTNDEQEANIAKYLQ